MLKSVEVATWPIGRGGTGRGPGGGKNKKWKGHFEQGQTNAFLNSLFNYTNILLCTYYVLFASTKSKFRNINKNGKKCDKTPFASVCGWD